MAIDVGYDIPPKRDECTEFMKTVEMTPESPTEYEARKGREYELLELPGNNKGIIVHVYNEGMPQQRVEVVNANWRKLKEDGLVAIVAAQRQQAMYVAPPIAVDSVDLRWSPDAIYYGVPARRPKPRLRVTEFDTTM